MLQVAAGAAILLLQWHRVAAVSADHHQAHIVDHPEQLVQVVVVVGVVVPQVLVQQVEVEEAVAAQA